MEPDTPAADIDSSLTLVSAPTPLGIEPVSELLSKVIDLDSTRGATRDTVDVTPTRRSTNGYTVEKAAYVS